MSQSVFINIITLIHKQLKGEKNYKNILWLAFRVVRRFDDFFYLTLHKIINKIGFYINKDFSPCVQPTKAWHMKAARIFDVEISVCKVEHMTLPWWLSLSLRIPSSRWIPSLCNRRENSLKTIRGFATIFRLTHRNIDGRRRAISHTESSWKALPGPSVWME